MDKEGESLVPGKAPGRERKLSQSGMKCSRRTCEARPAVTTKRGRIFLPASGDQDEQIYHLPDDQASWLHPNISSVGVSDRDDWLRVAWRVMSLTLEAPRLVFVDGNKHLALCSSRLLLERSEDIRAGSTQTRFEHDASCEHELGGDGTVPGGRRCHERPHLQGLCTASARPNPERRADCGNGQLQRHKRERVRELIEDRGCKLLYLPSYSPDLNPIKEAFSKSKGLLRRAQTREALVEALGATISAVSIQCP